MGTGSPVHGRRVLRRGPELQLGLPQRYPRVCQAQRAPDEPVAAIAAEGGEGRTVPCYPTERQQQPQGVGHVVLEHPGRRKTRVGETRQMQP